MQRVTVVTVEKIRQHFCSLFSYTTVFGYLLLLLHLSPFHQSDGDDDVKTMAVHLLRSSVRSSAVSMSKLHASRSSLILSIHLLRCLPLLLDPSTRQCMALTGNLLPSILITCPNHVSLRFLILSISVTFCSNFSLTASFLSLSLLVMPAFFSAIPFPPPAVSVLPPCPLRL